jgi:hypothetical protein
VDTLHKGDNDDDDDDDNNNNNDNNMRNPNNVTCRSGCPTMTTTVRCATEVRTVG